MENNLYIRNMLKCDKEILQRVRTHDITVMELANYLLKNFTVMEITEELSMYLLRQGAGDKVSLTITQLVDNFKLTGFKMVEEDGEIKLQPESRGRKAL